MLSPTQVTCLANAGLKQRLQHLSLQGMVGRGTVSPDASPPPTATDGSFICNGRPSMLRDGGEASVDVAEGGGGRADTSTVGKAASTFNQRHKAHAARARELLTEMAKAHEATPLEAAVRFVHSLNDLRRSALAVSRARSRTHSGGSQ